MASCGELKRSIIAIAASLAPPCNGPRSEPMAAVMQENRSDTSGGANPGGEGRGVEFVLGVEDQRNVHHLDVQLARLLAVQQVQEMAADGHFVGHTLDALAFAAEAIPVAHDRRERGQQAVGLVVLLGKDFLGFQVAQERAAGAHDVHRVGVGGDALQNLFKAWGKSRNWRSLPV